MTYNNGDNISEYVHFMSITKAVGEGEAAQYVLHNDFTPSTDGKDISGTTTYDSLLNAIDSYGNGNSKCINVIGICK